MTTETLSLETTVILIGAAVAILAILILALTRKLGKFLLLADDLETAFVLGRAMWSQAQVTWTAAQRLPKKRRKLSLDLSNQKRQIGLGE